MKRLSDRAADARDMAGYRDRSHGRCQGWRVAGGTDQTNRRGRWGGARRTKVMRRAQWHQFAAVQGLRDRRHQQQADAQVGARSQQSPRCRPSPLAASH
jgi:hypothetical protein